MECTFKKTELATLAKLVYLGNLVMNGERTPREEDAQCAELASKACAAYALQIGVEEEEVRERLFAETLPAVERYERAALPRTAAKVAAERLSEDERLAAQTLYEEALERDASALDVRVDAFATKLGLLMH